MAEQLRSFQQAPDLNPTENLDEARYRETYGESGRVTRGRYVRATLRSRKVRRPHFVHCKWATKLIDFRNSGVVYLRRAIKSTQSRTHHSYSCATNPNFRQDCLVQHAFNRGGELIAEIMVRSKPSFRGTSTQRVPRLRKAKY